MKGKTNCDCCLNNVYVEECDCNECQANLDEDDMYKYLGSTFDNCPYFQLDDEYKIVRKQI